MNAQSFARMRNQQSVHKRARMQDGGRTKSAQGRADPNDRNSTTPLHFRPLNKRGIIFGAGGGRTRNLRVRHGCLIKWTPKVSQGCETNRASTTCKDARWRCTKSAQGRADPNDRNSTTPLHFRPLNKRGIIFGAAGGRTRNLRVRHGCLIK